VAELSKKANPSKVGDAKPLGLTLGVHLQEMLARLPWLVREHLRPVLFGLQALGPNVLAHTLRQPGNFLCR
jgi:hypothetical protein